ncbi:hypothetical protein BOX15_Mlig006812g2 [Macrostomum lignano]|uniref:VWFA domain-containing protein n=2 Tax=Macrostomum lignano TaxID=282301 RepID=A0A267GIS0_9PLAT|nr:hypothetical protein BOX15_Mlig006812g2 [Macrostomum lignano]
MIRRPSFHRLLLLLLWSQSLSAVSAESDIVASLTELSTSRDDCSQKADIFFALDSSHSVGRANFALVRQFIAGIVSRLLARSDRFRFGVVIFSDKADMVVKLKDYSVDKPDEKRALIKFLQEDIAFKSGKTATGEAFQLIRELGFRRDNGRRSDALPVVVLLTDGRANGRVDAVAESRRLRGGATGASVLAIGIGAEVSRARLALLAGDPRRVSLVSGFEDLGKVSRQVIGVLCDGGDLRGASGGTASDRRNCSGGLRLIAGVCVPVKPGCQRRCPRGFLLVFPCACTPDVAVSRDCVKSCPESQILVRPCRCVPRHVTLKPSRSKVCRKACPAGKKLNAARCRCECKSKCPGPNFAQAAEDCRCDCSMRCRPGMALNKAACECQRVDCPPEFEYFNGRCRPVVPKLCPDGQVLFRDVCKRGDSCPKGYELRRDRKCYRTGCDPGFKRTKEGGCKKMCSGNRYYYKHRCHDPMSCGPRQYFRVRASGCPRTCAEPVRLARCPKDPAPGCVCQPYFLLHKGACVHPSECPRAPICIEKADVVFMLDSSLTVTEHNFFLMKSFVRDVVQQFYLRTGARHRVGVIRFNHRADIVMDLDSWQRHSHEDIQKKIAAIQYQPGLTFLGEALHVVRTRMWRRRAGMRRDVPRVTILLTDGTDTNGEVDQYFEAEKLRERGVFFVTIALGDQIGKGESRRSLEKLAGPEGRVFIFGLRDFQDIHGLVSRVLSFHCERPMCPHPYLVYSECTGAYKSISRVEYASESFRCTKTVRPDFKRIRCACPKPELKEGPCVKMYKTVTQAVYTLDKKTGICRAKFKDSRVRCACPPDKVVESRCVQYRRTVTTTTFTQVRSGSDPEGASCKPKTTTKSMRCACPKPVSKAGPCLRNFRLINETLFRFEHKSLTCTKVQRTRELRCSCPKPQVETAHCNGKFVPIKVFEQRVNKLNGCDDILWTGSARCSRSCSKRTDLAFVIDSSDSVRGTNFEYIRRFIVAVAKKLDVSRDNTHIALLKYSSVEHMKVVFNFVAHYNLKSMARRIMEMRYSPGSTYTGDALQNFRKFLLNSINGYRGGPSSGVDSVVVLVTDGASNSAVDPVKEAGKIKALGCSIVTIGVGDDLQNKELEKVASDPAAVHSFKTDSFRELGDPDFVESVVSATCRVGKVNKLSVLAEFSQILLKAQAQGVDVDWKKFGFSKLNASQLSAVGFKLIRDSGPPVTMATPSRKADFEWTMRAALSDVLRVHPFSIVQLRLRPPAGQSGSVRLPEKQSRRLAGLVAAGKFRFSWSGATFRIDPESLSVASAEAADSVRQAQLAPDMALDAWRPLRRLLRRAEKAAPHIKRDDARRLAVKELRQLRALLARSERRLDRLVARCAEAVSAATNGSNRKKRARLLRACATLTQRLLSDAAKVVRRVGYIRYFARAGDWANLRHGERRVHRRVSRARDRLPALLPLADRQAASPTAAGTSPAELRHRALRRLTLGVRELRKLHRALFAAHRLTFTSLQPALGRARGAQLDRLDRRLRDFAAIRLAVTKAYSAMAIPPDRPSFVMSDSVTSEPLDAYLAALLRAAGAAARLPAQARSVAAAHPSAAAGLKKLTPNLLAAAAKVRRAASRMRRRLRQFRAMPRS